jgi:hypothetical protein
MALGIFKATGLLGKSVRGRWQAVQPPYSNYQKKVLILQTDIYNEPVVEDRLFLPGCKHPVPCLGFKCLSSHHRGSRITPWCRGCDDIEELKHLLGEAEYKRRAFLNEADIGWCDSCWLRTMRNFVEKRVRDLRRWSKHTRLSAAGVSSVKDYREMLWARGTWVPEDPKNQ